MEPFTRLTAVAAPLYVENIDTGMLAQALLGTHRPEDLGRNLFHGWRYLPDESENPDFVLNKPRYRPARILLAGPNFGCGSSRESAVWALASFGFRCLIAPSFADIFRDNAFQNGLLSIALPAETVQALIARVEALPEPVISVDLEQSTIAVPGQPVLPFAIPADRRLMLLEGLDETMLMRRMEPDIARFEAKDIETRPWMRIRLDLAGVAS